jgi:hypothetical protein
VVGLGEGTARVIMSGGVPPAMARSSPQTSTPIALPARTLAPPTPYERRLDEDPGWAMSEGSRYFEGASAVQSALVRVTKRLEELGVSYAVAGGMALFKHGYRRFTEDVDILVSPDGLKKIHQALPGLGYARAFPGSKNLRDTEHGVRIEFLIAGQYPGDGKPKAIAFPPPDAVALERDGIKVLSLPALVELKLASGLSGADRAKDLADVQELIKTLRLPRDFAEQIHESVRAKYHELWSGTRGKRYMMVWRNKFLTTEARSLGDMIATLRDAVQHLEAMLADGVELEPDGGTGDDYARLVTTDPAVAKKYDMHEEDEFWGDDEAESHERGLARLGGAAARRLSGGLLRPWRSRR